MLPQEKFNAFFVKQSFFSSDRFRFWSAQGSGDRFGGGHTCVKDLHRVGAEVCAKFGGDWFCGSHVKEGQRYNIGRFKQSVFYL